VERIALESGGIGREYLLFRAGANAPLVVFLHGTGATAAWADEEAGWSRLAEKAGFAVALPEALRPDPAAPPKFLTNPQRWNDGAPTAAAANHSRPDDVQFLAAVIDDVQTRAGIDERCVYMSGFSNGAAMVFRAACQLADRVAAIAPVAGYCWPAEPKPARPVPTLYMIGSLDPLVPIRGGEVRSPWQHRYVRRPAISDTLARWARAIGCATTPLLESHAGSVSVETFPGPVPFKFVTVEGLGHHWPGGRGGLNPRIAGPTTNAVDGIELVWEFLKGQSLPDYGH
jgi:polyhydroxybutyrate depolymerase